MFQPRISKFMAKSFIEKFYLLSEAEGVNIPDSHKFTVGPILRNVKI